MKRDYSLEDLGADSLDHVEVIMALEEFYKVDIPDEVAEKVQTVEQVLAVCKKMKHTGSAV